MTDKVYWDRDRLIRINEAIEFDVISSIEFANSEILNVVKKLKEGHKFCYNNIEITTLEEFKIFVSQNISNANYFINRLIN